jgi:hypothetical protein
MFKDKVYPIEHVEQVERVLQIKQLGIEQFIKHKEKLAAKV